MVTKQKEIGTVDLAVRVYKYNKHTYREIYLYTDLDLLLRHIQHEFIFAFTTVEDSKVNLTLFSESSGFLFSFVFPSLFTINTPPEIFFQKVYEYFEKEVRKADISEETKEKLLSIFRFACDVKGKNTIITDKVVLDEGVLS